jgi:hypothetical protein
LIAAYGNAMQNVTPLKRQGHVVYRQKIRHCTRAPVLACLP